MADILKQIGRSFDKALTQRSFKIGLQRLEGEIKDRIRDGIGIRRRLKPLAASTISRRRRKTLHPSTSPEKSNATETGAMVDSITLKVIDTDTIFLDVSPEQRKKAEIYSAVRPFLGLTVKEERKLKALIEEAIIKSIR